MEIDTLDFAYLQSVDEAGRMLSAALSDVDAIIAHYTVAKLVIEVASREHRAMPVILLSPLLVAESSIALQLVRALLGHPPGSWILRAMARAKWRRLTQDRRYLVRQLKIFLGDRVSDAIVEDAHSRLRDPRSEPIVERTPEFLENGLAPIDPYARDFLDTCVILVGRSRLDRKTAKRFSVTVLADVDAAAMLQAPNRVARALRERIGSQKR